MVDRLPQLLAALARAGRAGRRDGRRPQLTPGDREQIGLDGWVDRDVPLPSGTRDLACAVDEPRGLDAHEVEPLGDALLDDRRQASIGAGEELVEIMQWLGPRDLVDVNSSQSA